MRALDLLARAEVEEEGADARAAAAAAAAAFAAAASASASAAASLLPATSTYEQVYRLQTQPQVCSQQRAHRSQRLEAGEAAAIRTEEVCDNGASLLVQLPRLWRLL